MSTHQSDTVCGLLIETVEAVENTDAILAVDGVDFPFVAQFDLSASMCLSGQFGHADFQAAVARIESAAKKVSMPLGGGLVRSREDAAVLFDQGYWLIGGFDILRLKASVTESVSWTNAHRDFCKWKLSCP